MPAKEPSQEQRASGGILAHLFSLRRRLRIALLALGFSFIVAFVFGEHLIDLLKRPLLLAWNHWAAEKNLGSPTLRFGQLTEPFFTQMSVAFWFGLIAASPVIFHQLWKFIAPAVNPRRRKAALPFAALSGLCFIGGAMFCYFVVLPMSYQFLLSYADHNISSIHRSFGSYDLADAMSLLPALTLEDYVSLTLRLMLAFGVVFELPILMFFLSWIGLVTHRGLWKFNRWATVIAFVLAAVLTPGPDVVAQVSMAIPLVALYNLSILIAFVVTRRRERAAAAPPADQ